MPVSKYNCINSELLFMQKTTLGGDLYEGTKNGKKSIFTRGSGRRLVKD